MATEAYKGHRAGSAKGKCHKVWDDTKDRAAVIKKAVALGKAEATGSTWASEFANPPEKTTKKAKKAVKRERPAKAAKKAAPKKAAKKSAKKPAVKREKLDAGASA